MKQLFTFLSLITLFVFNAEAQITYDKRIEIEEKDGYGNYKTFQFGESGMVVSYERDLKSGDLAEYYFDFYDNNLDLRSAKKVSISDKFSTDQTCGSEKTGHALLTDKKNNYVLITLDLENDLLKKVTGTFPKKLVVAEMVVLQDLIYVTGHIKKEEVLITVNWKTGKQKIIPVEIDNIKSKRLQNQGLQVLDESKEIVLYIKATPNKKTSDVYMLRTDETGKRKSLINISSNTDAFILSATTSVLEANNYIFTGTYSKERSGYAQGFYFSKSVNGKMDYISFFPFVDMKNFFSYLSKKQKDKIEKKIEKKKAKGKDVDVNYQMVIHDLVVQKDGYLVIGECYYPTYYTVTETRTTYTNGVPSTTTTTRQVFDGYQYTHAVVMKLDFNGKKIWDNCLPMYITDKPFRVVKFINFKPEANDQISMVYADDIMLVSKAIDNSGKVIRDKKEEVIIKSLSGDKVKISSSEVKPWYGDYFLAYGYQRIKNTEKKDVKRKRNVFFLSKVKYETN
jgi:hypothetical protein